MARSLAYPASRLRGHDIRLLWRDMDSGSFLIGKDSAVRDRDYCQIGPQDLAVSERDSEAGDQGDLERAGDARVQQEPPTIRPEDMTSG